MLICVRSEKGLHYSVYTMLKCTHISMHNSIKIYRLVQMNQNDLGLLKCFDFAFSAPPFLIKTTCIIGYKQTLGIALLNSGR